MQGPLDIYMVAIGGTGMAPLACLLAAQGHRVTGSDGPLYPPMSDLLSEAGIEPLVGFDPAHLDRSVDLVIIGNAVPRDNAEALRVEALGVERISMPQAVARFLLDGRRPLVVAGTHGKTTTSSMAAWVYSELGFEPGYLIGGVPADLPSSFAQGRGERFVIEGDEYNAAYFDRGPKFLHYKAETLILTSAEYDHADLYPDHAALLAAYRSVIERLPSGGRLIACGDSPEVRALCDAASCAVTRFGFEPDNDVVVEALCAGREGARFRLRDKQKDWVELPLGVWGAHNGLNATAVWLAAREDVGASEPVVAALARFHGVKRRLEELGRPGDVVVVDDFAHHPTEVRASIGGLRERYPDRPICVVLEPRSLTAGRELFFQDWVVSLSPADRVVLAPVFHAERLGSEGLDPSALARALRERGVAATACEGNDEVLETALLEAKPGDVIATMSSGSFDGMPRRLLAALSDRAGE